MRVVPTVHNLSPSAFLIALIPIVLPVDYGPLVRTATDDRISIRTHSNIQRIRQVALQPLDKRVVLRVPEADLPSRVTGHDRPVRETLDRPDQQLLRATSRATTQRDRAQQLAITNVKQADGAIGVAGNNRITVLEGNAEDTRAFRRRAHQTQEPKIIIRRRQDHDRPVSAASREVLSRVLALRGGGQLLAVLAALGARGGGLPAGLGRQTPDLAVVAAGIAHGAALLEIPLRHGRRVPDAEQAQTARQLGLLVGAGLGRILRPG